MGFPEELERIGTPSISWWVWGFDPKNPQLMVQNFKKELAFSNCNPEYINSMGDGIY